MNKLTFKAGRNGAINPAYFWDTDVKALNEMQQADYIIRRVFELGDIEEIAVVHAFYGTARCKAALLSAPYLRESAIIQGNVFLGIDDLSAFASKTTETANFHAL